MLRNRMESEKIHLRKVHENCAAFNGTPRKTLFLRNEK